MAPDNGDTGDLTIQVRGISKSFGLTKAVDSLSFEVRRGEVVGFLGNQRDPVPVSEAEVKMIEQRMEEGASSSKPSYAFRQGDKVKIVEGNFKDFTGTVEEVNEEKEKLRVFVEIFGRPTSVEFDFEQITTVEE